MGSRSGRNGIGLFVSEDGSGFGICCRAGISIWLPVHGLSDYEGNDIVLAVLSGGLVVFSSLFMIMMGVSMELSCHSGSLCGYWVMKMLLWLSGYSDGGTVTS